MPDQRSVMKEYRYLDEKRLAEGLTPAEQARLEKLRVLVGSEAAVPPVPTKAGFDVNAAAAALRESLLPAGLRNRPPPTPVQAPPAPEPEPAEAAMADALASEYEQAPFSPLDAAAEPAPDALFEPSSLGTEPPPYDPSAQGAWDPNQPYDPNAQQAWDPNQPYDPNAQQAWDPNQPYDPNAQGAWDPNQPYDPNAAYPADPNAQQAWDPNQPYDPNAAYPADPNAEQAWDPNQPYDPNAAYAADPNAAYPADAAYDPNAAPAEGDAAATGAYADAAYGAGAAQPQSWDVTAGVEAEHLSAATVAGLADAEPLAGEPAPPEGGSFAQDDLGAAEGWETQPVGPAAPRDATFGAYDEAGGIEPFAPGTLGAEPPMDGSLFDLDAGAESAPTPVPAAEPPPPELGEYDDTAGFGAEPFDAASVPPGTPGLDAEPALELDAGWQPEQALEAGFELASGGSFGAGADAAAPEWAQAAAPPPWEGAPGLDLEAPPAQGGEAAEYEISPAPASESFGTSPGLASDLFAASEGDLAAPEEASAAEAGAAPELDFSHPDFSGDEEEDAFAPSADLTAGSFAEPAPPPEPADLSAGPPLDLEPAPAEPPAPAIAELGLGPPEEPPPAATEELVEDATILEATDVVEEAGPEPEPAPDLAGFAEAAAAAVAAESTDLSAVIAAPPSIVPGATPADDFSFDVAEEPFPEPPPPARSFHAAAAIAAHGTPLPGTFAAVAPPGTEPGAEPADVDLSFDLEEPPAPAVLAAPPPPAPAVLAPPPAAAPVLAPPAAVAAAEAAVADEDIPTIDGADLLEEIVEDGGGAPPQSLDFEPLEPEPPVAQAAAAPPPAPAVAPPIPAIAAAAPPPPPVIVAPPPPPAPPILAPPPAPAIVAPPPPAIVAPPPVAAPPAAVAPPAPAEPEGVVDYAVPGTHRVVVHTVEGLVKRGVLQDPELDAPGLGLAPQAGATTEEIATEKVKAIFFMLAPGEKAPAAEGKRVRVTFRDGRQIAGFSPDYREGGIGFFMIPADTKTNTGRIWVYRAAVRQVAVS